jgi:hypothetical protein
MRVLVLPSPSGEARGEGFVSHYLAITSRASVMLKTSELCNCCYSEREWES